MTNNQVNENQELSSGSAESPRPALAVRHCGDCYTACCLPYKTTVFPNGWCNCNCGDCRVAKYATLSVAPNTTCAGAEDADICWCGQPLSEHSQSANHTFRTIGEG